MAKVEKLPFFNYDEKKSNFGKFAFDLTDKKVLDEMAESGHYDCSASDREVVYGKCNSSIWGDVDQSVRDNFRVQGHTLIPRGQALVWYAHNADHFMQGTFPAWAAADRPLEEVLLKRQLQDPGICQRGNIANSICYVDAVTNDIQLLNPYVGGDFNPFEMCDTKASVDDEVEINQCQLSTTNGKPGVCDDRTDSYFVGQRAGSCAHNLRVRYRNVDSNMATNVCKFKTDASSTFVYKQGVLGGREYGRHTNLYNDAAEICPDQKVCSTGNGQGLFWEGGNPLYHNKLQAQVNTGLLKMHLDDLAGHHIVLQVRPEGMIVHRTPLMHAKINRAEVTYGTPIVTHSMLSTVTHGDVGWLHNVYEQFKSENQSTSSDSTPEEWRWYCPLTRIASWSGAMPTNPMIPSTVRSARLFSKLNSGTKVHPTQAATHLPKGRLQPLYTSNGFCVCSKALDCSVVRDHARCGLGATIESLYDEQWRDLMDLSNNVCNQQLDWPYEGGTLRDGMQSPKHHTNTVDCSVFSRLPPVQVRSMPSGSVKLPTGSTEQHTLGGSGTCHMGRAAEIGPLNRGKLIRQRCVKMHTNVSHIVLQCDANGTITTMQLKRSLQKAPGWLIENTRLVLHAGVLLLLLFVVCCLLLLLLLLLLLFVVVVVVVVGCERQEMYWRGWCRYVRTQ